ncbi:aminopeptidase P family protein [Pseudochelatococcus lubricantis]|uniref:aminopeptidase P family protein n=1 Tax=Pseudochelatococcus lubricantis TaxID=1538102 RepID=UPI0035EFE9DB
MTSRYQSFDDPAAATPPGARPGAERLAALRRVLAQHGLSGFIVPRADEHQGEYVPAGEERLAWLTGFSGSAGTAVVLENEAAVVVDGRYVIQVREQIDTTLFAPVALAQTTPEQWIASHLPEGGALGYDPWLHTDGQVRRLEKAAAEARGTLVAVAENPLDTVWSNRPPQPRAPVRLHPLSVAGETAASKLARLRERLAQAKIDGLIVSDPHNIAWLFNIRGSDVPHTPIALGYALVPATERPTLFLAPDRFDEITASAVSQVADLAPAGTAPEGRPLGAREALAHAIAGLVARAGKAVCIQIDSATGAFALQHTVANAEARFHIADDPLTALKAVKNRREIEGARAAQRRDGAAVTRFLAWVAREAPSGKLTEIDVVEALEGFRRDTGLLVDISFPTIAGANENAALPHYRVTRAGNRPVTPGILLVDSGGQYVDGTTDITRTVAIGTPSPELRDRFTRVLKGHIAVATAVFPKGTSGTQIDPFARLPLWEAGLDFDHGTGHGVGSFLSVHEGPQRISRLGGVALEAGMILSNEPGYYREGHYGIRIENLLVVEDRQVPGADRPVLGFETITLAPIDRSLVAVSLLSDAERAWLNAYHDRVRNTLAAHVDDETRAWLASATAPL